MKNGRFSDAQIMAVLKQAEGGVPVSELCREHGMSSASFYKWRAKFGGMDASLISEMKDMTEQNRRLKRMYVEMSMQNDLLKEALGSAIVAPLVRTTMARVEAASKEKGGHACGHTTRRQHCAGLPFIRDQRDLRQIQPCAER